MSDSTSITHDESDHTVDELKSLLREAEAALGKVGEKAGEEVSDLRERIRDAFADGKFTLSQAAAFARKQATRTDELVRTNPYSSLGIATGTGLLIGYLLCRRCGDRG